jgi:hypothetical protein
MVPQFALSPFELFHWALLQPPHPCPMPLYLLDCHRQNVENYFNKFPTCTSEFFHQFYVEPYSSPTPL